MAKRGCLTHRKTRRLARALGGIPLPYALGVMESLWHATQTHAPNGAIGALSDDSIAEEMWWDGDPAALVTALVEAGIVDEHPEHRLVVHGWSEHCDHATHMALARKQLFFADGSPPSLTKLPRTERDKAVEFYAAHEGTEPPSVRTDSPSVRTEPPSVRTPGSREQPAARSPAPPRPAKKEDLHTHTAREGSDDPLDLGMGSDPDEPPPARIANDSPVAAVSSGRTPLPADFQPNDANRSKAEFYGLDVAHEVDEFVAHARDNGRESADWQAAFARWLNRSAKLAQDERYTRRQRASPGGARFAADRTTDAIENMLREARENDARKARTA